MRLMLISLIAMSGAACSSAPEGAIPTNPLADLQSGVVALVHTTQLAGDVSTELGEASCPRDSCRQQQKYRYVDCTLSGPVADRFVKVAGLARPTPLNVRPDYPAYFLEIGLTDGSRLTGYLLGTGEMVFYDKWRAFQLDPAGLKSTLALLEGPGRTCRETVSETALVVSVPAPDAPSQPE